MDGVQDWSLHWLLPRSSHLLLRSLPIQNTLDTSFPHPEWYSTTSVTLVLHRWDSQLFMVISWQPCQGPSGRWALCMPVGSSVVDVVIDPDCGV